MQKVFEIYVKTTPERLWAAMIEPEQRAKYNFGASVASDWRPGATLTMSARGGSLLLGDGEALQVDPPRRLVHTLRALWSADVEREGVSRVTWEIEPIADSCRLTLTHAELRDGAHEELYGGWPMILKTLLETGETLTTPGSLAYADEAR